MVRELVGFTSVSESLVYIGIISRHPCFRNGNYFKVSEEYISTHSFQHKCNQCNLSFPSVTSLRSHPTAHSKSKRYKDLNESTLKQQINSSKLVSDVYIPPTSELEDDNNNHSPSPPTSTPCSPIPDTGISQPDNLGRQSPIQLASSENIRTGSQNIPHPDDPPPFADFYNKFKSMLEAEHLLSWESFSTLLSDFINSQKTMLILKILHSKLQSINKKMLRIQSLYKPCIVETTGGLYVK